MTSWIGTVPETPMAHPRDTITDLLVGWSAGDEAALQRLMPLVVEELRKIAGRCFVREDSGHTLQPTALVNEVYLRLIDRRSVSWRNRAHFFGFAAQTMRRILVDHARIRRAEKRGDGVKPLPIDEITEPRQPPSHQVVAIDEALRQLSEIDPRQAQVVELRLFAGLTHEEIAEVLKVTSRTVKRDWRTARLWLHCQLEP